MRVQARMQQTTKIATFAVNSAIFFTQRTVHANRKIINFGQQAPILAIFPNHELGRPWSLALGDQGCRKS